MGGFHSVSKCLCGKQQFQDTYFLHHQQILILQIATLYLVPRKYIISLGFRKYPAILNLAHYSLACRAHSNDYGLVMPYSPRNSNQHWLEYSYLLCNRCQSITWIDVDLFLWTKANEHIVYTMVTIFSSLNMLTANFTSIFTGFYWCHQYPDSKVHVASLGPVGPRWAPCWAHGPCYQGSSKVSRVRTACAAVSRPIWLLIIHRKWNAITHSEKLCTSIFAYGMTTAPDKILWDIITCPWLWGTMIVI